jgi:hypothetical protein
VLPRLKLLPLLVTTLWLHFGYSQQIVKKPKPDTIGTKLQQVVFYNNSNNRGILNIDTVFRNRPKEFTFIGFKKSSFQIVSPSKGLIISNNSRKPVSGEILLTGSYGIFYGNFGSLILDPWMDERSKLRFQGDTIDFLDTGFDSPYETTIIFSHIKQFKHIGRQGQRLLIRKSRIDSVWKSYLGMADTIIMDEVDFGQLKGSFDISEAQDPVVIKLKHTDITKIKFSFSTTQFELSKEQSFETRSFQYQHLLKLCQEGGFTAQYEHYDKQFRELKYLQSNRPYLNALNKYWWDYGYDKGRVIYISVVLYFLFFLLNYLLLKQIRNVYWPEKFQDYDAILAQRNMLESRLRRFKNRIDHALAVALYTGYIFWGIKLDLKDIQLKNRWIVLLIIGQYITGIICLAYIANFIITEN